MNDLTRHIKEAIHLNKERLPLYSNLTGNKSLRYSQKLITYERSILLTSWMMDLVGSRYQKKGVPFMVYEFVEISEAKKFSDSYPNSVNYSKPIIAFDKRKMFSNLSKAIKLKSPSSIVDESNIILEKLSSQEHLYNMVRHIIESIRRIAFLIPLHEKASKKQNIKAPNFYSYLLIKSHQLLLGPAKTFDEDVAFIQNSGVPFLWQDLPEIIIDDFQY